MAERFDDGGRYLAELADPCDVRCPRCAGRARTTRGDAEWTARVVCGSCPYAVTFEESGWLGRMRGPVRVVDGPMDPVFGLELWLTAPFRGEVVWAYNADHLGFLRDYVAAGRRERVPNRNASVASRLPAWMKSAKNRTAVLAVLDDLEARARTT